MAKAKKTTCPISRAEFRANARPVDVTIGGQALVAPVKEFATGSLGWYLNAKTTIEINGVPVAVQVGLNLTIIGSKELPGEPTAAAAGAAEQSVPSEPVEDASGPETSDDPGLGEESR